MTAPNFRFRPGHAPDFQTKFNRESDTVHRCECGHFSPTWTKLMWHCLRPAGTWQQEVAA